jgi:6,7-dimethyl-8-ribityllumazine synthase
MRVKSRSATAGRARSTKAHVLVIESHYYNNICEELIKGALAALEEGGATYEMIAVPGALEIPQAFQAAVAAGRFDRRKTGAFDGVIVLGCVIRGETSHFDIVCNNANHWLMQVAIEHGIPVGNAILTVDTEKQAMVRAAGGSSGKGGDAARACLALVELRRALADAD